MNLNCVYQGDNLDVMRDFPPNLIDLIYIDPPFCSQRIHKTKDKNNKIISFDDKWKGGTHSYISWLIPRFLEFHRILKDTGVLCVHLDYRSVHYAKVELDKIFGYKNFVNSILWCYNRFSRRGKGFPLMNDTILVYSKTKDFKFNPIYTEPRNNKRYEKGYHIVVDRGEKKLLVYNKDKAKDKIQEYKKNKNKISYTEAKKPFLGNLWNDISIINPMSKERLGYPTQKPLELLDRLIEAFTHKGDFVADFFCGSGTTLASAQNLGRKYIGVDISEDAILVTKQRMLKDHNLNIKIIS